jgi:hypothetical protein
VDGLYKTGKHVILLNSLLNVLGVDGSVSPFGLPHFIEELRSTTVLNEKKSILQPLTSLIFNP